jgi:DNA-directed RNA polymerase specialized sigma24 family protein
LKYKEVAELLGLSVKTVEAQLAIALKKIAAVLKMQEAG